MIDETKKTPVEVQPTVQPVSTDKSKTTDPGDNTPKNVDNQPVVGNHDSGDNWTPPTKDEWEKIQKKAEDFEKSVELKRLAKLEKKDFSSTENENQNDMLSQVREEGERILSELKNVVAQKQTDTLRDVYKEFISEHKWADSDETFQQISDDFDPGTSVNKDELLAKLKGVAMNKFPVQYQKAVENKIAAKAQQINAGDIGGGGSVQKDFADDNKKQLTPEQIEIAKKCGNDPGKVYSN